MVKKPKLEVDPVTITSLNYRHPGLSEEQVAARAKGLGASDAEKIMAGQWMQLWREKTGRQEREDLSTNLAVQLGHATEAFNAWWYTTQTKIVVDRSPALIRFTHQHAKYPWMLCNIDGLVEIDKRPRLFEAKHTNPFGSKGDTPARYLAQVQHILEVMDLEGCEMSVLFGNSDWQAFSIERDKDYAALMIEREQEFWEHVRNDTPPPGDASVTLPSLELMEPKDMRANNQWGAGEGSWIQCKPYVDRFKDIERVMKEMIPPDCDFAWGEELVGVRDKAGKLSIRYPNKKDSERLAELRERVPLEDLEL